MNRRGHRGRVDSNHAAIVEALRKTGWQVLNLAPLGSGAPDLLAWRHPEWRLIEVKTPRGRLTRGQAAFLEAWPVTIIRSVDEVLAL